MNQRAFSLLLNGTLFLVRVGVGFLAGWMLWHIHPIVGIVGGVLTFGTIANIAMGLVSLFHSPKGFPICKNGKCESNDHEFVGFLGNGMVTRCKCGNRYYSIGERCLFLDSGGIAHPYMVFKNKKDRWVPDASGDTINTNAIQEKFIRERMEQQKGGES